MSRLRGATDAELTGGQRPESMLDGGAIRAENQGQPEEETISQSSAEQSAPREHREGMTSAQPGTVRALCPEVGASGWGRAPRSEEGRLFSAMGAMMTLRAKRRLHYVYLG